jgi:hypothetical protein
MSDTAPPIAPGTLDGLEPVRRSGSSAVLRVIHAPAPAARR